MGTKKPLGRDEGSPRGTTLLRRPRRRTRGHDYCVVRLGIPGVIRGFDVDTSYFTGNFPPQASIDACVSSDDVPEDGWTNLVGKTELDGDSHHLIVIDDDRSWSHLRLNIFPDGGVSRLRLFGRIVRT